MRSKAARRRLDQLTLEIDADFDRYPSVRDSEEDALLNGIRGVFSQQRTFYITILAARPAERRRQAESIIAAHLVPVQKKILDWSGKLQAWNSERLQHADRGLVTQFANLQGSLSRVLTIGFGSGQPRMPWLAEFVQPPSTLMPVFTVLPNGKHWHRSGSTKVSRK
jgi:hypothetical protein